MADKRVGDVVTEEEKRRREIRQSGRWDEKIKARPPAAAAGAATATATAAQLKLAIAFPSGVGSPPDAVGDSTSQRKNTSSKDRQQMVGREKWANCCLSVAACR
jgi:hypothetical protein